MNRKCDIILIIILIEVYILYLVVSVYIVLFEVPFPGNIIVGVASLNLAILLGWVIIDNVKDLIKRYR